MASTSLLSAYHHAANPSTFDMVAAHRESAAAHSRTHPGAGDEEVIAKAKAEKEQWGKFTAWLMDERRVEKLRALVEERDRRLKAVTQSEAADSFDDVDDKDQSKPRKKRVTASLLPFTYVATQHKVSKVEGDPNDRGGIFKVSNLPSSPTPTPSPASSTREPKPTRSLGTWGNQGSPVGARTPMSSYIRPALSAPYRSSSPRRAERRRNGVFAGIGEFSPRPRGGTYTPPRVLPNGDETAVFGSPSPAPPSLKKFDFVSPLGPVKFGTLTTDIDDDTIMQPKNKPVGNLEAVLEEGEDEDNWSLVTNRRHKRAGSAPVEKTEKSAVKLNASDDLVLV